MQYIARTDIIKNNRLIPTYIYRGKGRRLKAYSAYGFFQMVLPSDSLESDQTLIQKGRELCKKIRIDPLGVLPFCEDYCYCRGIKYPVILRTRHAPTPAMLAFASERTYEKFLKEEARKYLSERISYWAPLMGLARIDYQIRIVDVFSYIGQNRYSRNILSFSYYLLAYEPKLVDAIVVHELAHTYVHNHSLAFYQLVHKFLPDYRQLLKCVQRGIFNEDLL